LLSNNQISDISGVAYMTHQQRAAYPTQSQDCNNEAVYLQQLRDRGVTVSADCPGF